jgi:hypothetical protein
MASTVSEWSPTASSNTTLGAIGLDGATMPPSQIDNALRELMAQVAAAGLGLVGIKSADIASATTTDLSTRTGNFVDITGTTTITGLGTVDAGQAVLVRFTGALTLTHNATSLILPGTSNITTAANDRALMISLGSGNWLCAMYEKASGGYIGTPNLTISNATPELVITDSDTNVRHRLLASSTVGSFFFSVDADNVGS